MKKIVISGGTGLIGSQLVRTLKSNYKVVVLTRSPEKYKDFENVSFEEWNGQDAITSILDGAYAFINLIGENIGDKMWTTKQKERILNSRVEAAYAVNKSMSQCPDMPKVWIQASAAGYYGQLGGSNVVCDELSPKGEHSFLADVCAKWEKPIREFEAPIRKIIIRTGVVLSPNSLLMQQVLMPFKFGVAVVTGKGNNYLPWIDISDEVGAIHYLLENEDCEGIYNLVAPHNITMKELVGEVKKRKKTFITLYIPELVLQLIFGKEKTREIILTNQLVAPKRLLEAGYTFLKEKIEDVSLIEKK